MAAYVQDVPTFDTNAGNKNAIITPAVNALLVVCFAEAGQAVVGSIADNQGGTYTIITSYLRAASAWYGAIAVRNSLVTSAVAHTVTMTAGGTNTGGGLDTFEFSGMKRAGQDAVRRVGSAYQFAKQDNGAAGGTPTCSFGSTPLTANAIVAMMTNAANPATMTPPAGLTERRDVGFATPTAGLETATADSGFTSLAVTWGSTSATAFGDAAIELDASTPVSLPWVNPRRLKSRHILNR